MKKTILTLLLMMAAMTSALAYDFEVDGIYYYISNTGSSPEAWVTFKTINTSDYHGDIVIPETVTYNGTTYPVTAITRVAFYPSSITSVVIPNSVKHIDEKAFYECRSLRSMTLSNSLERIGREAFSGCAFLETDLVIPNSVISIGLEAFKSCSHLKSVTIGNSITHLTQGVFKNCVGLESITIPDNVKSIGAEAFYVCRALTSLSTGNSVQSIGDEAFLNCSGLTDLTITKSVTSIGSKAFEQCYNLSSITVEEGNTKYDSRENCNAIIETASNKLIQGCNNSFIPNTVTTIGSYAFKSTLLESIVIPNSVDTIDTGAFQYCHQLANVDLGNSVKFINYSALNDCRSLRSLNIPASLMEIKGHPFSGCSSLTSISVDPNNPYFDSRENCNALIRTADNHLVQGCVNTIIPNSVTTIGAYSFFQFDSLTSIIIPENVSLIEPCAFVHCSSLMDVTCLATTPPEIWYESVFDSTTRNNALLSIPGKSYLAYKRAVEWPLFSHIRGIGDIPGDMDGDGQLSVADLSNLISSILNGSADPEKADVNQDGIVNIADISALIECLL